MNKSQKKYKKMADQLSKAGRFGDTRILHVNEAELAGLGSLVPSGKLPTNPETGQPEAGILTAMLIGAVLGATSGGITAKQKKIPLWQGILQGAGIGLATGAVTGGIGSVLGSGGGAAAQAGVETGSQALQETASQTLQQGIEQGVTEGISQGAQQGVVEGVAQGSGEGLANVAEAVATSTPATPPVPDVAVATTPTPSAPVAPVDGGPLNVEAFQGVEVGPGAVTSAPTEGFDPTLLERAADLAPDVVAGAPGGVPGSVGSPVPPTSPVEPGGIMDSLADNLSESFSRESLKEYASNPLNYLSPIMATEAFLPSEYDEEDYLAGYSGPYDKSWTSGTGISWAANDGGPVVRRSKRDRREESLTETPIQKIVRLAGMANRVVNPTLPGKFNPLSDEEVQIKIRPSLNPMGMHRIGVTLPFNQGGLASLRRP